MHSKIAVSSAILAILAMAPAVSAHSVIISAVGDAGANQGAGLGMDPSVPRDGTRRNPFQQDSTIFRNQRSVAQASGCGTTLKGGANNINTLVSTMAGANAIPQVKAGGTLNMQLHQVNADGAGPYTCMIDATGLGTAFQEIPVTTNVQGTNGNRRQGAETAHPLAVTIPAGMQCTGAMGGMNNICMVRCQNSARNGPFGGCVPVQMVAANAANGGNTGAAPVSSIIPAPSGVNGGNTGNNNGGNNNNGNNNGGNFDNGNNNNGNNNNGNNGGNFNNGNNNNGNNGQNNGGNNNNNNGQNGGNFDNGNNNNGNNGQNNGGNFNNNNGNNGQNNGQNGGNNGQNNGQNGNNTGNGQDNTQNNGNNGQNNGGNFNNNNGNNGQNNGNQNTGNNGQNTGNNGQNTGNNGQNNGGNFNGNNGQQFRRLKRWTWQAQADLI